MARKKKNTDESSGADVGIVMTCSLFLIILTFFILLNSIAVIDDRKQRLAIGSLVGSFGSLSGGLAKLKTGESMMPSTSPLVEHTTNIKALLNSMDMSKLDNVSVDKRRQRATISLPAGELFKEGTHEMKSARIPHLDRLGAFINEGDYPVVIIGHTDNRPASQKGYASNWEETTLMAMEVFQYLVEKGRVSPQRVTAYGRSDLDPTGPNETAASRRLNRRVQLVLKFNAPKGVKRMFKDRPSGNFTYKRFNFEVF